MRSPKDRVRRGRRRICPCCPPSLRGSGTTVGRRRPVRANPGPPRTRKPSFAAFGLDRRAGQDQERAAIFVVAPRARQGQLDLGLRRACQRRAQAPGRVLNQRDDGFAPSTIGKFPALAIGLRHEKSAACGVIVLPLSKAADLAALPAYGTGYSAARRARSVAPSSPFPVLRAPVTRRAASRSAVLC